MLHGPKGNRPPQAKSRNSPRKAGLDVCHPAARSSGRVIGSLALGQVPARGSGRASPRVLRHVYEELAGVVHVVRYVAPIRQSISPRPEAVPDLVGRCSDGHVRVGSVADLIPEPADLQAVLHLLGRGLECPCRRRRCAESATGRR